MEAAVTKPEAASAGIGMMSESGNQTQEVMAGVFFFPGLFQLLSVHLLLGLKYHVIAPVNKNKKATSQYLLKQRISNSKTWEKIGYSKKC